MDSKYNLDMKVAVVTGAAEGIGKAIAAQLYLEGAFVVLSDVQVEKGKEMAKSLGSRAIFIECDISDQNQVETLIQKTVKKFGKLDIMVNNAGINSSNPVDRVPIHEYPNETWHRMINVDLNGTFYGCKAAAKVMVVQKFGSIINIASTAGVVALRLQIGFVAAKAGIIKMTEAMACELAPFGIRTNTVSPGSILTESTKQLFYSDTGKFSEKAEHLISFIPQNRPGYAREIADAVSFLASENSSYINGHNLVVDGGWTCGFNRDF